MAGGLKVAMYILGRRRRYSEVGDDDKLPECFLVDGGSVYGEAW